MIGPGKYDDLCTQAREATGADGAILLIFNGTQGTGFSCQAPLEILLKLPTVLRSTANQIEADQRRGKI